MGIVLVTINVNVYWF